MFNSVPRFCFQSYVIIVLIVLLKQLLHNSNVTLDTLYSHCFMYIQVFRVQSLQLFLCKVVVHLLLSQHFKQLYQDLEDG